jgi:hypothetical protein
MCTNDDKRSKRPRAAKLCGRQLAGIKLGWSGLVGPG